jgi:hypothetical protein
VTIISFGKSIVINSFVLENPPWQIRGNSRVKHSIIFIGHDVDVGSFQSYTLYKNIEKNGFDKTVFYFN